MITKKTAINIITLAGIIPAGTEVIIIRKCEKDSFHRAYGTKELYHCHVNGFHGEITIRASEFQN